MAFLSLIVLNELPFYLAMLILRKFNEPLPVNTYFEQLIGSFLVIRANNLMGYTASFGWSDLLTYPYLMWKTEGPAGTLLLLAATAYSLREKRLRNLLPASLFILPIILFSFLQANSRYLVAALPYGWILVGSLIGDIGEKITAMPKRWIPGSFIPSLERAFIPILLVFFCITCLPRLSDALSTRPGYREAAEFLRMAGHDRVITTNPAICRAYLDMDACTLWPENLDTLRELHLKGYRYAMVDWMKSFFHMGLQDVFAVIEEVEAAIDPAFTIPNAVIGQTRSIFEVNFGFESSIELQKKLRRPENITIRIYDLREYFEKKGMMGS
jgi:hypothetical protein